MLHDAVVQAALSGEVSRLAEILALDVERAGVPAVGEPYPAPPGHVVADLPDRPDGVLQGEVTEYHAGLDHPQDEIGRADLQQGGCLAHVRVADDHVKPPVALRVRVRLVPCVDDRPGSGGGRGHTLPDVLRPLAHAVDRSPGRLQHLARAADELPGDEEWDEDI